MVEAALVREGRESFSAEGCPNDTGQRLKKTPDPLPTVIRYHNQGRIIGTAAIRTGIDGGRIQSSIPTVPAAVTQRLERISARHENDNMSNRHLLILALTSLCSSATAAPQSAYVQRMMSLDRNKDGVLSAKELPGKLAELLKTHDADSDGSLSPQELGSLEDKAMGARDTNGVSSAKGRVRGSGRGRRGSAGGASEGKASPLDTQQILRFALSFDRNGDGGLNADELRRYADALARRRATARANQMSTDLTPGKPDSTTPAPSIKSSPKRSAAPTKGLSADGKGDGGFGDAP